MSETQMILNFEMKLLFVLVSFVFFPLSNIPFLSFPIFNPIQSNLIKSNRIETQGNGSVGGWRGAGGA